MRLHRFYVNKPLGEEIVVESAGETKELVHQWQHVFRYTSGDEVFLFSPHSPHLDYKYTILSLDKKGVTLACVSTEPNKNISREIVLCMALVKKDTFETVVRQATELGITTIIPIQASRSEKKNLNFERLQKIAIEASEQSGRGTVPTISPVLTINEACEATREYTHCVGSLHGKGEFTSSTPTAVWVGPEGGWTEEEEEVFKSKGFLMIRSVSTTLKADTAAINLLSLAFGYSS